MIYYHIGILVTFIFLCIDLRIYKGKKCIVKEMDMRNEEMDGNKDDYNILSDDMKYYLIITMAILYALFFPIYFFEQVRQFFKK